MEANQMLQEQIKALNPFPTGSFGFSAGLGEDKPPADLTGLEAEQPGLSRWTRRRACVSARLLPCSGGYGGGDPQPETRGQETCFPREGGQQAEAAAVSRGVLCFCLRAWSWLLTWTGRVPGAAFLRLGPRVSSRPREVKPHRKRRGKRVSSPVDTVLIGLVSFSPRVWLEEKRLLLEWNFLFLMITTEWISLACTRLRFNSATAPGQTREAHRLPEEEPFLWGKMRGPEA